MYYWWHSSKGWTWIPPYRRLYYWNGYVSTNITKGIQSRVGRIRSYPKKLSPLSYPAHIQLVPRAWWIGQALSEYLLSAQQVPPNNHSDVQSSFRAACRNVYNKTPNLRWKDVLTELPKTVQRCSGSQWINPREKAIYLIVALRDKALDVLQTLHAGEAEDFD